MYHVLVHYQQGHTERHCQTFDSIEAHRFAVHNVSHNPKTVWRVEIHDNQGCLRTVYCADWDTFSNARAKILYL